MEEEIAQSVISWYSNVESKAVEFTRYVPLVGENLQTWSPFLAEIIVEAGSIVDSVLRNSFSPREPCDEEKRKNLKINDFCRLYRDKYDLHSRKVILISAPPEYRAPFDKWEEHNPPEWWKHYTALKHNRIQAFRHATWTTTIDALAGALLCIATRPVYFPSMMRRDWIDFRNITPERLIELAHEGWKQNLPVSVHTNLFALILGGMPLPEDIKDLEPHRYGASPRLMNYLGKY